MCISSIVFFFFFSSRRRHTRSLCDWSSDVCSSDLFASDNAYRDAANDLQLRFFTSEPDYPRSEGAPYAMPYGTTNGTIVQGPATYFTTMAQFVPGALAAHRDFAGYSGPEARIAIMEARERGSAGAQEAYDYLWPFIGTGQSFCGTNGTANEPYLACRAGFALDPYPMSASAPPPPPPPPSPSPCTFTLSTMGANVASAAATGSVSVTASATSCPWTAASNTAWITVSSGASATGSASVGYSVAANTTTSSRTGTIAIAGQTFTVSQAAGACTYSLSPSTVSVGAAATSGSVAETAPGPSCTWAATSNDAWITVTGAASGKGSASVGYSVAANTATTSRTGSIAIAGQ